MKTNVMVQLVWKDWQLQRLMIIICIVSGLVALAILRIGGQTPIVIGSAFFFISMMFCACMLPMTSITNEKKKQTLPFLMSLPVSASRYGVAKLLSTFGMFLVPWLTLIGAGLYMIVVRHALPNGTIPTMLILANLPFIGFCIITGTALVGESEGWGVAAVATVNSSYWLAWYLLVSQFPSITRNWAGSVADWNPVVVKIVVAEFASIVLILALTLYLQSRKRSFV